MVELGLVTRTTPDAGDRRPVILRLTAKGRALEKQGRGIEEAMHAGLDGIGTDAELATVIPVLERVVAGIRRGCDRGADWATECCLVARAEQKLAGPGPRIGHYCDMDLASFARDIHPKRTVLVLGAGVSVPSGGMTGAQLAEHLCLALSDGQIESSDLSEAASLLESRYGRVSLVEALARSLKPLRPDGGLKGLVRAGWARVFTTNFDELVERACKAESVALTVIRSNRDFKRLDLGGLELLKIHGCITQDRALGNVDSMVLTENDYRDYESFREALFGKLVYDMHTKDVLVIGQSLRDAHLKDLVDTIAQRAAAQTTSNKIRVLTFNDDEPRIRLLEERGLRAAAGSLSQLLEAMSASTSPSAAPSPAHSLPTKLLHRTIEVKAARKQTPDAVRLFNGGSATHADVAGGLTFRRKAELPIVDGLSALEFQYAMLIGASGVGKSTMARRLLDQLSDRGFTCYEHKVEFPLDHDLWAAVARKATDEGKRIALLVDEAPGQLTAVNRLVQRLEDDGITSLVLVLTAHAAQWEPRSKSPVLLRRGVEVFLRKLEGQDIEALVDLCRSVKQIRALVDPNFLLMSRGEQVKAISDHCSSEMFVALKYCFPGADIDRIILEEYSGLSEVAAEVYKTVALLEAAHGRPSRQLVLEVLGLSWEDISTVLASTRGVLFQRLVSDQDGLYLWNTRHRVVAEIISFYKFTDQAELEYLFSSIISKLNISMLLDRQLVPALCDNEFALGRIQDLDRRIGLLEQLALRGDNRVPWHRLIAAWLEKGDLDRVARTIAQAESSVGLDSPIHRYKIRLLLRRAESLRDLGTADFMALLLQANDEALWAVGRWPSNKYSYQSLAEVAVELFRATGNHAWISETLDDLDAAYDHILDAELLKWRNQLERVDR